MSNLGTSETMGMFRLGGLKLKTVTADPAANVFPGDALAECFQTLLGPDWTLLEYDCLQSEEDCPRPHRVHRHW